MTMTELRTSYRIRGLIPPGVAMATGLASKARSIGAQLSRDAEGNLEGIWKATPSSLKALMRKLQELGLQGLIVERSFISATVSVKEESLSQAQAILRDATAHPITIMEDPLNEERVLNCLVDCESAADLQKELKNVQGHKMIATACYIVTVVDDD